MLAFLSGLKSAHKLDNGCSASLCAWVCMFDRLRVCGRMRRHCLRLIVDVGGSGSHAWTVRHVICLVECTMTRKSILSGCPSIWASHFTTQSVNGILKDLMDFISHCEKYGICIEWEQWIVWNCLRPLDFSRARSARLTYTECKHKNRKFTFNDRRTDTTSVQLYANTAWDTRDR